MKSMNVRELRSAIPHLSQTLAQEQELILISNGQPIARILPIDATPPTVESLAWLRALAPAQDVDSAKLIREERDRRGT
jgi:antitoxin (DNA-binding transcriptional repressor) of toxin-antitoxin stability system